MSPLNTPVSGSLKPKLLLRLTKPATFLKAVRTFLASPVSLKAEESDLDLEVDLFDEGALMSETEAEEPLLGPVDRKS